MKYQSELIKEIIDTRGHEKSSPHYESECVESWIEEAKGAYPKLCDYESEWLNYINEKPLGVFPYETLVDITKATVDNVVPYAYKSAILKGQTLVNISSLSGEITIKPNSTQFIESSLIQQNKTFTFMFNCTSVPSTGFIEIRQILDNTALKMENINVVQGYNKFKVTTVNKEVNKFRLKNDSTSNTDFVFNNLLILDGDYINIDVPYFEGMQSVKMPVLTTTGKNLFDGEFKASSYSSGKAYFPNKSMSSVSFPFTTSASLRGIASVVKVKPNTSYSVSISNKPETGVLLGSGYENVDSTSSVSNAVMTFGSVGNNTITTRSFTTTSNCNYMVIGCYAKYDQNTTNIITFNEAPNIQLEESSAATEYEPYKSIILTVNEDVTLRSNGDVYDELNLLTGRLTQRIDENNEVLAQAVVKTVDLAVVNQDGDSLSKLIPIEDTMHLSTSSNTINPLFSGEIPVEAITQNLTSFIEE